MKLKFKQFNQKTLLNEGSDFGIPHVEDLEIETFLRVVEKLHELEAVQKLDGANLRVGIDERGEMFTSREQKGGRRFYRLADFPKNSAYDGFKAAHAVLEKAEGYFSEILSHGETINLEIIFGSQPNTVFYGKDNLNYIALLEVMPGDDPSIEPDQKKIAEILKLVKGKIFVVKTIFGDTSDGITIVRAPQVTDWKFIRSDVVPSDELKSVNFTKELAALKVYLKSENLIARKLGRDLTNFEVLKDKSQDLADEKKSVQEKIMTDFKLPIKEKMLKLVYKQKPSMRGEVGEEGAYDGIEGIIFYDHKTREKFKIVDKDVFTAINKFNYQTRKGVATRITSIDPELPIEARGGIVGEAKIRSAQLFGLGAELPQQSKKALEKFKGETREDTIEMIVKSLNQLNFSAIKRKIQAIYISAIDDLEDSLNSFKENAESYTLTLKDGQTIKYTKEIKRRTLMSFAEARRQLIETVNDVKRTTDLYDLIDLFFTAQLDQLFGDE
jgi:hypothetical protein